MKLNSPNTAIYYLFKIFLFLLFFFLSLAAKAQLQADFNTDKAGGCSPLSVLFTNTTRGASGAAIYSWDFGNGNTSVLKDAGAVFYDEKTYTITLTVTDGTQIAVKTKTITVYKKPIINFNVLPASGCLPLQSTFTSSSLPGDGIMSSYHWDFGDGIIQSTISSSIVHTYNFLQTATVGLTAVNSYGCSNTIIKPGIVTVYSPLLVSFTADRTITCDAPATIQFTNTTTGTGTFSYLWEFGDNTTSTEMSPSHTYTVRGNYSVKLSVASSTGCTTVITKPSYLNIANFNTSFQEPSLLCSNGSATFLNTSTPTPGQSIWLFDGVNTINSFGNSPVSYAFGSAGPHTIQLTGKFGPCSQTITRTIEVKPKPVLNGFIINPVSLCGAPVQVNFQDTTQGAIAWQWQFNWPTNNPGTFSTLQSPSYTYTTDNAYQVGLTVTNADGCTSFITKSLGISRPLVGIFLATGYTDRGCDQLTVKFKPRTTEPIASYQWNFGDAGTSADPEPVHTYTQPGTYTVTLTYTTSNGCTGTVSYNSIYVFKKPVANFSVQPTVCGNTPVVFNNMSSGSVTSYAWNFGDHGGFIAAVPATHQYYNEGDYNVTLIATNGSCSDTITKPAIIHVFPPFPKIGSVIYTCDGTRGKVTFTDISRQTENWHWSFGDNASTSYTTAQTTVEHTYNATGVYQVILTATNGGCTVKDATEVRVLLKQNPVLTPGTASLCAGNSLNVQVTGLQRPPFPPNTFFHDYPYNYLGFYNRDGTSFSGNISGQSNNVFPWSANLFNFTHGNYELRAITQSASYGCKDTSNFITISVKGPSASINVIADNVCYKELVSLQDASAIRNGIPIMRCDWDFGDGFTTTSLAGATITHRYTNAGNYFVTLKVTDAEGCISTSNRMVSVKGPKAFFWPSGTNVPLNTTISFSNTTNSFNSGVVNYQWTFGDGATAASYSPLHTYTVPGTYIVTLIAQGSSCSDTTRQTIVVNNFNPGFTTTTSFLGDHALCPPVMARFINTSTGFTSTHWDFGDGFTLDNQNAPAHVYHLPGVYIVKLTVRGFNGLTSVYTDTIHVSQPQAAINADDITGCIGHQLTLNAPSHTNAVSYLWDFGNGFVQAGADSFFVHQYQAAGSYFPSLIVKDNMGCAAAVKLSAPVIINPDPVINITPANPVTCKTNSVQLQATGASSYSWSPATGLNDPTSASPLALPVSTTNYLVSGIDNNGCKGTDTITVTVPASFTINLASNAAICAGDKVQLNVSGAAGYKWINNTVGLSNTQINNPFASPSSSTQYTVVGYDKYQCYSDTQNIHVIVNPLPTVDAGTDRQVVVGSSNQLIVASSNDVIKWNWSPVDFLSCTNCASPVSKPYEPMDYVVTVYNRNNCMAKDTVKISVVCAGGDVHIPNAFTPDNNGKNDKFFILGQGVRIIKSLKVFNRWGEVIFEKKNFYPNDQSAGWNGKFKGLEAPAGAYVYFAEMECEAGSSFMRKGTVTLIR